MCNTIAEINNCTKCILHTTRKHVVTGSGNLAANIMLVGEAPGYYEDKLGEPFVGKSGELLNNALIKVGITRQEIYITNVVKCRTPANRVPMNYEIIKCVPYLIEEINTVNPKIIISLGATAFNVLTGDTTYISNHVGKIYRFAGKYLLPCYHPAYLLRNPSKENILSTTLNNALCLLKQLL